MADELGLHLDDKIDLGSLAKRQTFIQGFSESVGENKI